MISLTKRTNSEPTKIQHRNHQEEEYNEGPGNTYKRTYLCACVCVRACSSIFLFCFRCTWRADWFILFITWAYCNCTNETWPVSPQKADYEFGRIFVACSSGQIDAACNVELLMAPSKRGPRPMRCNKSEFNRSDKKGNRERERTKKRRKKQQKLKSVDLQLRRNWKEKLKRRSNIYVKY